MNRTRERPWFFQGDFGSSLLLCVGNVPFPLRDRDKCIPVPIDLQSHKQGHPRARYMEIHPEDS